MKYEYFYDVKLLIYSPFIHSPVPSFMLTGALLSWLLFWYFMLYNKLFQNLRVLKQHMFCYFWQIL